MINSTPTVTPRSARRGRKLPVRRSLPNKDKTRSNPPIPFPTWASSLLKKNASKELTINQVKDSQHAIACFVSGCDKCHRFTPTTRGVAECFDSTCQSSPTKKFVNDFCHPVPASFKHVSAHTETIQRTKEKHGDIPQKDWAPLFMLGTVPAPHLACFQNLNHGAHLRLTQPFGQHDRWSRVILGCPRCVSSFLFVLMKRFHWLQGSVVSSQRRGDASLQWRTALALNCEPVLLNCLQSHNFQTAIDTKPPSTVGSWSSQKSSTTRLTCNLSWLQGFLFL